MSLKLPHPSPPPFLTISMHSVDDELWQGLHLRSVGDGLATPITCVPLFKEARRRRMMWRRRCCSPLRTTGRTGKLWQFWYSYQSSNHSYVLTWGWIRFIDFSQVVTSTGGGMYEN
jgi:hypothetical protein